LYASISVGLLKYAISTEFLPLKLAGRKCSFIDQNLVSKEEKDDKKDVLYGDGGTRLLDKEEDRTRLLKEDKTRLLDNKDQTRKLR
jgi:hypothetical protein